MEEDREIRKVKEIDRADNTSHIVGIITFLLILVIGIWYFMFRVTKINISSADQKQVKAEDDLSLFLPSKEDPNGVPPTEEQDFSSSYQSPAN